MRWRRGEAGRPPFRASALWPTLALTALVVTASGCTGLAETDPAVHRGPSGAAVLDESQAAAAATGGGNMVKALRRGGFVLVFQHTATDRKAERRVDLTNCSTQRNLSATGRQQAIQLGNAVKQLHIPIGPVVTSPYCRTRDTGWLAFQRAEAGADLAPPADGAEGQVAAAKLRSRLATPPPLGTNTILMTHAETVAAILGIQLDPGEVLAYQARPSEQPRLVTRFSIAALVLLARFPTEEATASSALEQPAPASTP